MYEYTVGVQLACEGAGIAHSVAEDTTYSVRYNIPNILVFAITRSVAQAGWAQNEEEEEYVYTSTKNFFLLRRTYFPHFRSFALRTLASLLSTVNKVNGSDASGDTA